MRSFLVITMDWAPLRALRGTGKGTGGQMIALGLLLVISTERRGHGEFSMRGLSYLMSVALFSACLLCGSVGVVSGGSDLTAGSPLLRHVMEVRRKDTRGNVGAYMVVQEVKSLMRLKEDGL